MNFCKINFRKYRIWGVFMRPICSKNLLSWQKYRIEIHSEPIRTIPIHSDICIRVNANHSYQSEKIFVSRLMKNRQKSIRFNLRYQSESIQMIPRSDWKLGSHSFRLMPRTKLDWVGLIFACFSLNEIQKVFRIGSDTNIGMNRNSSDWLGINFNPIFSPGCLSNF